jgi:inner membrane protein involved in colicin E2 resistance
MPFGDFVNQFPSTVYLIIHATAFLIGVYFAWRAFEGRAGLLGTAFSLFALAEISYITYHLDWTVFLFAHTVSDALNLIAFILVFVWASRRGWATGAS